MKCPNCNNEMDLYKTSTQLHFTEKRWRCMVCGEEVIDPSVRKIPKPKASADIIETTKVGDEYKSYKKKEKKSK